MKTGLAGKSVIVTGGTSGIGRAAADAFLAEGCRVAVCDFRQDLIDEINCRNNSNHMGFVADVTKPEQIKALLDCVETRFGGVDVMVNNAGVGNPYGFSHGTVQQNAGQISALIACCNAYFRGELMGIPTEPYLNIRRIMYQHGSASFYMPG